MTVSEKSGVYEEAAAPVADGMAHAQAEHELHEVSNTIDQGLGKSQDIDDKEKNFKALREKQEQLQREYEKERKRREEYEQILQQQLLHQKKQEEPEVDEFEGIDDDDWLTKKQSQKLALKLANEAVKKALDDERKRRQEEELPTRLKTQFQDFDDVVTEDNVKQLRTLEPEVATALSQIGDKYAQAVAAYKYIKKFVPEAATQKEYKERVEKNSHKPGTLASVGNSTLSQATTFEKGLTPELKSQLFREMQEASKRS